MFFSSGGRRLNPLLRLLPHLCHLRPLPHLRRFFIIILTFFLRLNLLLQLAIAICGAWIGARWPADI